MKFLVGTFQSRADADRAIADLRSIGISQEHLNLIVPGGEKELEEIPATETEQPGMGRAVGGVVGSALGAAAGAHVGAVAATAMMPGVGPVLAFGIIAASVVGLAGGAAAGAKAGKALEQSTLREIGIDELYVYEDALRKGRTVLIAEVPDESHDQARAALERAGAESIDAARENWWVGVRDSEELEYDGEFKQDEPIYRRGFEAALVPEFRGKTFADAKPFLERRGWEHESEAFRRGFERGRKHDDRLRKRDYEMTRE